MGERTAVRWHGSSFCSIKGRAGHYFGLGSVSDARYYQAHYNKLIFHL